MAGRPKSVMERAYGQIKNRIMTLELAPGAPIDDLSLSEELGISRTPAREALFRLASEGLVIVETGRSGFTVKPLEIFDLSALFEAHMVTARAIARLVAVRRTPADIAQLRKADRKVIRAIERQRPADVASTNADLHRLEASIANNGYLSGLACSIHDHGQRLGYLAFGGETEWEKLEEHFQRVRADHTELIDAYEDRDPDHGEAVAARHVHLFRDRILAFITEDAAGRIDLGGQILAEMRLTAGDHGDADTGQRVV
jgi:DNA-binding GntR family transcriptional regulator